MKLATVSNRPPPSPAAGGTARATLPPKFERRYAVRTPMQWSAATKRLSHPILDDPRYAPARVNVSDQRRDPDALFNWLGQLIRERKERPEFGWGRCQLIETENPAIFAHRGDWDGGGILVIHNLAGCHTTTAVSLGLDERQTEILSDGDYEPPLNGGQGLELAGYSYRRFRIRRDGQRILA